MAISHSELTAYYRGARTALHFVEARRPGGRRFGPDADARWKAFAGGLTASARLDLLIQDANAEWPGAFGARNVFALEQVAEDDAFGPHWERLDPVLAEELWREAAREVSDAKSAMREVAQAWGLSLAEIAVPAIDAAERVWVAGPSAVASLAQVFAGRSDLDWAAQVTCIATPPAHRQLATFCAAVADAKRACAVKLASAAGRLPKGVTVLMSDDAAAEDRTALHSGAAG